MKLPLQTKSLKQLCQLNPETKIADVAELVDGDSIRLPKLNFELEEKSFLDLLLPAISLTPSEKICLLLRLSEFTVDDIQRLITIFQNERKTTEGLYQNQGDMIQRLREKSISEIKEIIAHIQKTGSLDVLKNNIDS